VERQTAVAKWAKDIYKRPDKDKLTVMMEFI